MVVEREHRLHRLDLRLAGEQPGMAGRLQRGLHVGQLLCRERRGGRARDRRQACQHALRGGEVAAMREQQAAELAEGGRVGQCGDDVAPQRNGTPAERRDVRAGVVEFRQRAEHPGRAEGRGALTVEARLRAGRRVEHADAVAGARQPPGQQPAQQAGAGDAEIEQGHGVQPCRRRAGCRSRRRPAGTGSTSRPCRRPAPAPR
ncbi:hypothetical protein Y694_04198 [Methylibium sp. T29-B]|nr:hypothetical protein Y694_04198 [Methylibium sp. T29-B]